jgi:gas vesicle protein
MSPTELTAIIGGIAAILGAPGFVAYVNKRSKGPTVTAVANMYKEERDRLEKKVDSMSVEHDRKIAELKASGAAALAEAEGRWQKQHERDQSEIARLREEIDSLYRRMYQAPPRHAT